MADFIVRISGEDRTELERLTMDGDKDAAMDFLKKKVLRQIKDQESRGLSSHVDGGQAMGGFKGPH
ncbi:MAG: hypothetical protein SWK76_02120 [Actinomycetota bacterium]|nr:hypothetical protein [Actinomycetota bacterium]